MVDSIKKAASVGTGSGRVANEMVMEGSVGRQGQIDAEQSSQ